ncbi:aminoglycoside 6-adenylyltransferase [Mycobacteroides franklinii]|uniref:Aminoglycoside 6-adenylyltransferase n=1 Tax=Mycobacteroides franklinii TaxID=948102 RepID=A0A4R8QXH8_9MYCO|nr:aminoglycoside 6-adenylyltransferase [Mycobacteroides franklinii]TDZ45102.1 Aminoglycoside 6-adenylyltransferase [Mycobacteroides franklinii]TDZ48592.1 Aminoglycoside 6-adenylyltransferase [Mycobacteroides franklinii]TDZ58772.1 Aminoglycoside 6-adenylyltransferase [Mycobacteroides franklinii]TDZ66288.1 Aminoglycoside 6-adenylyltransferase [Mycobacteroides franklinii]TDZ72211.1 Aminoglycoside 6-adenylyltransferase [Mycobacteroides franklinii]
MNYGEVLERLVGWAAETDAVRAVIVVGSGANGDPHPLSDRDIELYASDPDDLADDESWWSGLGEVLVVERLEDEDSGYPTLLIYYAGGKLDFTLIPAEDLSTMEHDRPFQVLLDKDAHAPDPDSVSTPQGELPDEEEFEECVNWGYAAALMCAKAVVRDELWSAKLRDQDLKEELLRIIEWDHLIRYGTAHDRRYLDAGINSWVDSDIRDELNECWGHLQADDTVRALRHTVDLFARLATRAGTSLGQQPFDHDRLRRELDAILALRDIPVRS